MILKIKASESSADKAVSALECSFPKYEIERNYQNFHFWFTVNVTEEEYHEFLQGITFGMVDLGDVEIV